MPTKSTLQLTELLDRLRDETTSSNSMPPKSSVDVQKKPTSQLAKLEALTKPLDHLHRLSVAIRNASDRNPLSRAMKVKIIGHDGEDISAGFDAFVRRVIDAHFSFASEKLRLRISNAISIRRRQFLYAKDHQIRLEYSSRKQTQRVIAPENPPVLSSKPPQGGNIDVAPPPPFSAFSSTVASEFMPGSFREPITLSQPSSTTSSSPGITRVRLPPPPEIDLGQKESKCPYCCLNLPQSVFSNSRRWHRHIEVDLRPYICIHEDCTSPDMAFRSRKEWLEHLNKPHFSVWVCPLHKRKRKAQHLNQEDTGHASEQPTEWTFTSPTDLEHHLLSAHEGSLSSHSLPLLIKQSAKYTRLPAVCPLCGLPPDSVGRPGLEFYLRRHVADHLLDQFQLSFPLPNPSESSETAGVSNDSSFKDVSLESQDEAGATDSETGRLMDDFKLWRKKSTAYGTLDPFSEVEHPFLPFVHIDDYFSDTAKFRALLHELLPIDEANTVWSLDIQLYKYVFCILLIIGKGDLILDFVVSELSDESLPTSTLPSEFPLRDEKLISSYLETQWMVWVPKFKLGMAATFDPRCILPIISKEKLDASVHGRVYRITLEDAYNELASATEVDKVLLHTKRCVGKRANEDRTLTPS